MIEQKKFMQYNVRMMIKRRILLPVTLILCTLCCFFAKATDYKAVDGDSLVFGERRIRLDGIDAPEFVQQCYTENKVEYPCGKESWHYLAELLEDSVVQCDCLPDKDKYGRDVCECYADEILLNKAMVSGGYAMTYRSDKYFEDEQSAKLGKRGIWRGKFMRPALFRALERLQKRTAANK